MLNTELGSSELFAGESVKLAGAGYPMLTHATRGCAPGPLIVLVPGGGHLARVFYGHPGSRPTDFLNHWLLARGCSVASVSYPLDHPLFERVFPAMHVSDWGEATAQVAAAIVSDFALPPRVLLVAWSMGSKLIHTFTHSARRLGLEVDGFISLAASPPLVGLAPSRAPVQLSKNGLRQFASSSAQAMDRALWGRGLEEQNAAVSRTIIPADIYHRLYRGDHPLSLRAEADRVTAHGRVVAAESARADARMFDFENFPLAASIVPRSQDDQRHALTDATVWAFLTQQALYQRVHSALPLAEPAWRELLELAASLAQRLTLTVEGGHFFFVGEPGARTTAEAILGLQRELEQVRHTIDRLGR